ncbi:MAG TPA: hypothetical protein VFG47_15510, partial [Geminicoccaceae bacterium]|nr:hypothetical protein [Geminicoccaceae bacterium]
MALEQRHIGVPVRPDRALDDARPPQPDEPSSTTMAAGRRFCPGQGLGLLGTGILVDECDGVVDPLQRRFIT